MRTIHKFKVEPKHELQTIELPWDAEIVSAIEQNGDIMIYVMLDANLSDESSKRKHQIYVVGTGWKFSMNNLFANQFIGTVKVGPYVWHIFEVDDLPF